MDPLQQDHQDLRQWLQKNKEVLCQQLSVVPFNIIDKAEDILTVKEYRTLNDVTDNSVRIADLLNIIIRKSSEDCKKFVQIMQLHSPLITKLLQSISQGQCHQSVSAEEGSNVIAPLVSHTNTGPFNMDITLRTSSELKASDQLDAQKSQNYSGCGQTAPSCSVHPQPGTMSSVRASGGSNVFAPVINYANVSDGFNVNIKMESVSSEAQGLPKKTWLQVGSIKGSPKSAEEWAASIPNKIKFLKDHLSELVQKVKNVDSIVDELITTGLHSEMASKIRALPTAEEKMRKIILDVGNTKKMAEAVVLALCRCQRDVMEDLLPPLEA